MSAEGAYISRVEQDTLRTELDRIGRLLLKRGYDVRPLIVEPPATRTEVEQLEKQLGSTLPQSFRDALLAVSRSVDFTWFAPPDLTFDPPFDGIFSGCLAWSLESTLAAETNRRSWVAEVFRDPGDAYDRVWHDKLGFADVGNGDIIAFELGADANGAVVYLSHDDGEGHGYWMAANFADLIASWVPLACVGGEDWQWLPFTSSPTSGIDPHSPNGRLWRETIGIADA